jgi:hypothetical protein
MVDFQREETVMSNGDAFTLTPDQVQLLTSFATHPALRRILKEIQDAPPEQRLATAERIATAEALQAEGLQIPPGLKITTRYFEDPKAIVLGEVMLKPAEENFAEGGGGTLCLSVGEIVCASYGWEALK